MCAGIDLNPLDVADSASPERLETLVWPEHDECCRNLLAAARLVAEERPLLMVDDLYEEFEKVVTLAAADATVVVFHSAVLVYLSPDARESFVDEVRASGTRWISNEGESILPEVAAQLPVDADKGTVLASTAYLLLSSAHTASSSTLSPPPERTTAQPAR